MELAVMKKNKNILVSPSILSADFCHLGRDVKSLEAACADWVHVDVMDGNFVPNISIGSCVVADLRKQTSLPLDVHLMIQDPLFYLDSFIKAGSNIITVHCEVLTLSQLKKIKKKLKENSIKLGVSINPETHFSKIRNMLSIADMVLVMSVHPGFGGQKFIADVLPKIRKIRGVFKGDIQVDGGITHETAPEVVAAGANILVAGSYVFGAKSRKKAVERLKNAAD